MKEYLFKAFYQGKDLESLGAGNCASLALIKAAMFTFGFNVFACEKTLDNYHVTLKNGVTLGFTESELLYASRESSFVLGAYENASEKEVLEKLRSYAYLCFTVICKMAQKNGDFSNRFQKFVIPETFELAVEIMNDGTGSPEVYELLGLENNVSPAYRTNLVSKIKEPIGMVMWTVAHAMYANNGYFDLYGKKLKFKGRVMLALPGKIATGVFQLKP
jgi:hypothetical protein